MRRQLMAVVALVALLAPPMAGRGQQAPPFRSGVELVLVEATVLDRDGAPVHGLGPADFTVTIDGKARNVTFVDDRGDGVEPAATAADAPTPEAPLTAALPDGRIVIFVVDRDTLAPSNELALLEAAGGILDSLGPADAAGLLGIPVGAVEVTRELDRVRAGLRLMSGTRPTIATYRDYSMTWEEALGFERRDRRVVSEVVERECYQVPGSASGLGNRCPEALDVQAREMLMDGRAHVQTTTSMLQSLAERLAPIRGSKHVVLISGGMPYGVDLQPWYEGFARKAAQAGIALYAIHLDQPDSDASNRRTIASAFGGRDMSAGLTFMTGMTGGSYFSVVGAAPGAMNRIRASLKNYYVLGVETTPADRSDRLRALKVEVRREGLTVRARRDIASPPPSKGDVIAALLGQPTDIRQVPFGVTAYTTRGTEAETLRVLLAMHVEGLAQAPVTWGYQVLKEGNLVATGKSTIEAASGEPIDETVPANLPPGRYRLRVAASDASGRVGVVDQPLIVGMRAAGTLQLSDLVVGEAADGRLMPRGGVNAGTPLSALVEVLSAAPGALGRTRMALEIIPGGSTEPVRRLLMAARSGGADTILVNSAEVATADLAPGPYTASAVALVDNEPVGRVSRAFEVRPAPESRPSTASTPVETTVDAPRPAPDQPDLQPILEKMAGYVAGYGDKASLIVAVERYTQVFTDRRQTRVKGLVAEFAIVKALDGSGWVGFRDVVAVDGDAVRDRRDRLQTLFTSRGGSLSEAMRIANEGSRFNVGPVSRNFNVPTAALFFFLPPRLNRFAFRRTGSETIDGVSAVEIAFTETARPTLVTTTAGADVPVSGVVWVDPATGAVLRTRLDVDHFADRKSADGQPLAPVFDAAAGSSASIDVRYRLDAASHLWLASQMDEYYEVPSGRATGHATYSDFKRFDTSGKVVQ